MVKLKKWFKKLKKYEKQKPIKKFEPVSEPILKGELKTSKKTK
jgi:hypothetical protein